MFEWSTWDAIEITIALIFGFWIAISETNKWRKEREENKTRLG